MTCRQSLRPCCRQPRFEKYSLPILSCRVARAAIEIPNPPRRFELLKNIRLAPNEKKTTTFKKIHTPRTQRETPRHGSCGTHMSVKQVPPRSTQAPHNTATLDPKQDQCVIFSASSLCLPLPLSLSPSRSLSLPLCVCVCVCVSRDLTDTSEPNHLGFLSRTSTISRCLLHSECSIAHPASSNIASVPYPPNPHSPNQLWLPSTCIRSDL